MKSFVALTAFAALAAALPTTESPELVTRGCYVPGPNQNVIDRVYAVTVQRGLSYKMQVTVFETMQVESNYNNLDCGDQDSLGAFQQRPSQGWGSRGDILNVEHSANAFIDAALACNDKHPSWSSGQIAQCAQISEFPDRYDQAESGAKSQLAAAASRHGGKGPSTSSKGPGGAINVAPAPPKASSPKPKPKPNTSSGSSKASTSGCKTWRAAKKGDTCSKLAGAGNISLSTFYSLNGKVNKSCNNLQIGTSYCIAPGAAVKASTGSSKAAVAKPAPKPAAKPAAAKPAAGGCAQSYTVKKGDNCYKLADIGGISLATLLKHNPSVNAACTNLQVGKSYCVKA